MKKKEAWVLLLFAGLLALFFRDTWLTAQTYFARDITYVFHPRHVFTAENLQAGRLPLWNPYAAGGAPWLGDPETALFYPGSLFFFLFPFVPGFKLFQALHFFLTGAGAFLLVRSRRGSPGLAFFAAILWSLNGFWVARLEFPSLLGTVAWLPFLALFGRRRSAGRGFSATLLGAALSLSFLAGHIPHFFWCAALLAVWMACAGRTVEGWRVLGGAGLLAAGLCAPQWLPTLETLKNAGRFLEGIPWEQAALYSLRPANLLGIVSPWFSALKEHAYTGERFFWLGSFYIGAAGVLAAALAFRHMSARGRFLWAGVLVLGAVLGLGHNAPPAEWLRTALPFLRGVRFPAQFAFFLVGAALLAAAQASRPLSAALRPKVLAGVLVLSLAELFLYGHRRFPVLPSEYFHTRPHWIAPLQASADRFFLSPKASLSMRGEGAADRDRWTDLRHRLFNQSSLPYHIRNANFYGYAFLPRDAARFLEKLYASPGFEAAADGLNRFNVRWVAAAGPLSGPSLALRSSRPWHVYENLAVRPLAVFESRRDGTAAPWRPAGMGPGRQAFRGEAPSEGTLRVAEFFYPGWEAYAEGRRVPLRADAEGFWSLSLPAGAGSAAVLFRPAAFRGGLWLGGLALGLLGGFCIIKIRRRVFSHQGAKALFPLKLHL